MKKQVTYLKIIISSIFLSYIVLMVSCKKEDTVVSQPLFQVGKPVDNTAPLTGAIKGTMLTGKDYTIGGDVIINKGDTLVMQEGVNVYFSGNYNIIVKGNFLSLGSQAKPNYITVKGLAKTDTPGAPVKDDPAYKGTWGGILGDTTTNLMVIKWTHVEFGCNTIASPPTFGLKAAGGNAYMISFVNPNGTFVLEDSWVYGGVDDPIRIQGGKIHIMRNTFEKGGSTGGEYLNIKSGTIGNVAYNLMIGAATNGIKPSNNGGRGGVTTIVAYNNTIVASGYRRSAAGRGGSINFEEKSKGAAYNNIIANCRYGLRIVGYDATYSGNALKGTTLGDISYGNNLNYVDSLSIANQIYPYPFSTKPQTTDIPAPSSFLPTGYVECYSLNDQACGKYDGTKAVQVNDPLFKNFPFKQNRYLSDVAYATGFDFHLQSGSPAIGKGFTGFTILSNVPVNPNFGATEVTPPNIDLGAYPSDGKGNKH